MNSLLQRRQHPNTAQPRWKVHKQAAAALAGPASLSSRCRDAVAATTYGGAETPLIMRKQAHVRQTPVIAGLSLSDLSGTPAGPRA